MATTVLVNCDCGRRYSFYIPKQVLNGEIFSDLVSDIAEDWAAIDEQEERDGEIALAEKTARSVGARFVDYRDTQVAICECGSVLNIRVMLTDAGAR